MTTFLFIISSFVSDNPSHFDFTNGKNTEWVSLNIYTSPWWLSLWPLGCLPVMVMGGGGDMYTGKKNICAHFLWPFYLVFLQMTKNLKKNCKYLIWKWLIQQWRFYKNNLDVSLIDVVCITIFKLTRPINFSSPYLYDEIMKQHPSFANGHTTLNAPLLVRSAKLSNVGSGQYLDGWPPGNTRCCWLFFWHYYVFIFWLFSVKCWGYPLFEITCFIVVISGHSGLIPYSCNVSYNNLIEAFSIFNYGLGR